MAQMHPISEYHQNVIAELHRKLRECTGKEWTNVGVGPPARLSPSDSAQAVHNANKAFSEYVKAARAKLQECREQRQKEKKRKKKKKKKKKKAKKAISTTEENLDMQLKKVRNLLGKIEQALQVSREKGK